MQCRSHSRRRTSECLFVTACSMDEYAEEKRTEKNLIVRSGISEAETTNNKRLRSTFCIEAIQTRSIARPLCDSRASCLYCSSCKLIMSRKRQQVIVRDAMYKHGLCRRAVSVSVCQSACLDGCLSRSCIVSKRLKIRQLLWNANRKRYLSFPWVPLSMTSNTDLKVNHYLTPNISEMVRDRNTVTMERQ